MSFQRWYFRSEELPKLQLFIQLTSSNIFPFQRENFTKNEKYKHVVNEEKPENLIEQHEGFLEIDFSQPINANKMEGNPVLQYF